MSRAETTAMLSKLVEKRLRNRTAFWASEVNFDRLETDSRLCAVLQRPVIQEASGKRNPVGHGQS